MMIQTLIMMKIWDWENRNRQSENRFQMMKKIGEMKTDLILNYLKVICKKEGKTWLEPERRRKIKNNKKKKFSILVKNKWRIMIQMTLPKIWHWLKRC